MADYDAIRRTIDANIYANGEQKITGEILNDVLNEMVDVQEEFNGEIDNLVENYPNITINGDVTNAPDEEDLTSDANNRLKFANRPATNGMGYVILRKNKTFAEQVTQTNTIYEIRYEFDLGGEEVTIPENCVLKFEGGKLSNGTIMGQETSIDSSPTTIFGDSLSISGTWSLATSYCEWFLGSTTEQIQKSIDAFRLVTLCKKTYDVDGTINISYDFVTITSVGVATINYTKDSGILFNFDGDIRYFRISNLYITSPFESNENTSICFNSEQGHAQSHYSDLFIGRFNKVFYNPTGSIWDITYEQIRCQGNNIIFYNRGTASINIAFRSVYFDHVLDNGICVDVTNIDKIHFDTCNFGGLSTTPSRFARFGANVARVKFTCCNFEDGLLDANNPNAIEVYYAGDVEFDSCYFHLVRPSDETRRYFIKTDVSSRVRVNNCRYVGMGTLKFCGVSESCILDIDENSLRYVNLEDDVVVAGRGIVNRRIAPAIGVYANRTALASLTAYTLPLGYQFYDTNLKKWVMWNGTSWVNMDGTALA